LQPTSCPNFDPSTSAVCPQRAYSSAARIGCAIQRAATDAGREIEPDHFGINLAVCDGELPDGLVAAVKRRRPDVDPADLIATAWPQLHRQLDAYLAVGLTKFVIRPALQANIDDFIDRFVAELIPRQN